MNWNDIAKYVLITQNRLWTAPLIEALIKCGIGPSFITHLEQISKNLPPNLSLPQARYGISFIYNLDILYLHKQPCINNLLLLFLYKKEAHFIYTLMHLKFLVNVLWKYKINTEKYTNVSVQLEEFSPSWTHLCNENTDQ